MYSSKPSTLGGPYSGPGLGSSLDYPKKGGLSAEVGSNDETINADQPTKLPVTIELWKPSAKPNIGPLTQDKECDYPVVYEAHIHDRRREKSHESFTSDHILCYRDVKPLQSTATVDPDDDHLTSLPDEWKGPAILIRRHARAHMPWVQAPPPEKPSEIDEKYFSETCNCPGCKRIRQWKDYWSNYVAGPLFEEDSIPATLDENDIVSWSLERLIVKSPFLFDALREMVEHYPGFYTLETLWNDSPKDEKEIEFKYPYLFLLHHYPKIETFIATGEIKKKKVKKEEGNEDKNDRPSLASSPLARKHMELLRDHIAPIHSALIGPLEKLLQEPVPKIPWEMVGLMLKPGIEVYVRDEWTDWYMAKVSSVSSTQVILQEDVKAYSWKIMVSFLSCDGTLVGRVTPESIEIDYYKDTKEVTALEVCPVSIWDAQKGNERRKKAIKRGKLIEASIKQDYILANYDTARLERGLGHTGNVIVDHRRGQTMTDLYLLRVYAGSSPYQTDIADEAVYLAEAYSFDPRDLPQAGASGQHIDDDSSDSDVVKKQKKRRARKRKAAKRSIVPLAAEIYDIEYGSGRAISRIVDGPIVEKLSDEQLMLLYPVTFAFSLKTKQWIAIDATYLEEIKPSDESLDNLVIGPDELSTIKALANRLTKTNVWSADFIEGKGTGGIILLHGPPGVGKTYTVEAIAESLHLPLLSLTVADIGNVETQIENELARWFTLSELWGCVLLIDEADIFLERRSNRDLARNSLVAAFLRRAEYFRGLLFLTTNRVGQIDDAFISRVHVAIRYNRLQKQDLVRVWQGFFKKLARDHSRNKSKEQAKNRTKIKVDPKAEKWVIDQFAIGEYASLNGRDIRNALQTTITLAEFELEETRKRNKDDSDADDDGDETVVELKKKHFKRVLDMSYRFHDYVNSIRREDERKRANLRGDRNDYEDDAQANGDAEDED